MFGFFRSKSSANPSGGLDMTVVPSNDDGEKVNLVEILAECLINAGFSPTVQEGWLELPNGLALLPELWPSDPLDDGRSKSVTTIQISHPEIIRYPVLEYQHSNGHSLAEAISKGFNSWLEIDLPVLNDCLLEEPEHSMTFVIPRPDENDWEKAPLRRVLLGPMAHYRQKPDGHLPQADAEHPPQCPCCFFTSLVDDIQERLHSDEFIAIRFYGLRNAEGNSEADCRLNGEDWEAGKQALIRYVDNWSDRGFEFRKQFGIIQTVTKPFDSSVST